MRTVLHRVVPLVIVIAIATASATAQARGSGRIEGSVLDQNGEPVPAARITLFADEQAIARTASDAEGTFRFGHLPRLPMVVEATGPGSTCATERVRAFSPDGIALADLTLRRGGRIAGTVLDPDGAPIARAAVATESPDGRRHAAGCDGEGHFVLDHVPFGECLVVAWAAPHVAAGTLCDVDGEVTTSVRLQRGPGRTLRFRVLGLTAAQQAVARMDLFCVEKRPQWCLWALPIAATANRQSSRLDLWEITDLPPQVEIRSASLVVAGARTSPERLRQPKPEDPLDELTFRVEPEPVQTIRGIVRDEGGQPLRGIGLEIASDHSGASATGTTAADGTFALELQIENSTFFTLRSTSPAWSLCSRATGERDSSKSACSYRTVATKDFVHAVTAFPATSVAGRVVDLNGDAVPNARVRLKVGGTLETVRSGVCDSAGRFEFLALRGEAVNEFLVVAERRGGRGRSAPFLLRDRASLAIDDVRLEPTASIAGRLLAADGSAMAGRVVCLRSAKQMDSLQTPRATCTTDAAGRFRFAELEGSAYRLWTQEPPAQCGDAFVLAAGSQCTRDLVLPAK